ncbi:P-loop containing nucleoside triphosphate hydrolase protein [Phakopsora pachyrhizi]|nr:P-loop containing nucleoside triphosphate hydrolase protein [Phakopsora pachyrhizi]
MLISTANLSSSTVARTKRQMEDASAQVELKRRLRAQETIRKMKRFRSGHHSQSDSEDSEDQEFSGETSVPTQTQSTNNFSGAISIDTVPDNLLKTDHCSTKPSSISVSKVTTNLRKPTLGSALSKDAVTLVVKRPSKKTINRKRSSRFSAEEDDEDSFDSSESPTEDEDEDLSDSSIESVHDGSQPTQQYDEDQEWQGCEAKEDDQKKKTEITKNLSEQKTKTLDVSGTRVKGSIRDWANAQLQRVECNEALCDQSLNNSHEADLDAHESENLKNFKKNSENLEKGWGPLGEKIDLQETSLILGQRTTYVDLSRSDEVLASRSLLPVFAEENTIMDAVRRHPVVVICGETGSGKTTQVPQFLYEAGWGSQLGDNPGVIGVTQPRRVAAVSMAKRVEAEMGLVGKGTVGYQIRYDTTANPKTKLKFMTDGIILRELASDFLLSKYSAIIVDEAHERSVNTDVLIGLLSRIVRLRMKLWDEARLKDYKNQSNDKNEDLSNNKAPTFPLRLIIMSATLRVSDFTLNKTLFSEPPPVIEVGSRQYPVAVHFNRRTTIDYVGEAYKKACKIHSRLPPGGILIFLTGQLEIMQLCRKLEKKLGRRAVEERNKRRSKLQSKAIWSDVGESSTFEKQNSTVKKDTDQPTCSFSTSEIDGDMTTGEAENFDLGKDTQELAADVDQGETVEDLEALDTDEEDEQIMEGHELFEETDVPMHILPLYSLLPTNQQMKVFEDPPPNTRLVIVATNVAETSLTIPNIRYVIDSGRAKERHYDLSTGIQTFEIDWISKASAAQRAGRAGRTGPGHCYRLYSSAVYENYFSEFSKPEILRMPIDGIVLQMKSMNIDTVTNFPFPTPPDRSALQKAELSLSHLGALSFPKGHYWSVSGDREIGARITELGRAMARYPLSPRFAKMLVSGFQHGCLPYVIAMVSILSVGDPFIHETAIDEENVNGCLPESMNKEIEFIEKDEIRDQEIRKQKRRQYFQLQQKFAQLGGGTSDIFKILAVVGAYEYGFSGNPTAFCHENFVRPKAMEEIHKLRGQITKIVAATTAGTEIQVEFSPKLRPPTDLQIKVLRQLITAAFVDQVAIQSSIVEKPSSSIKQGHKDGNRNKRFGYRAMGVTEEVFIHPSSIFSTSNGSQPPPDFVVFQELQRTESAVWIKGITKINSSWLPLLGKSLCSFSKPIDSTLKVISSEERKCCAIPRFGGPGLDVELSPIEVTQRKVGDRWVWV